MSTTKATTAQRRLAERLEHQIWAVTTASAPIGRLLWIEGDERLAFVATTGVASPPPLSRLEAPAVAAAVPKRRAEFAWGRWCARSALRDLGHEVPSIAVGPQREPIWPAGCSGSISHVDRLVCAAATTGKRRIGIDIERLDRALDDNAWSLVLDKTELARFSPGQRLIAFSAKEALFKVLFPEVRRTFGFEAARVRFGAPGEGLDVTLCEELTPSLPARLVLEGNYVVVGGFVLTWIWR